MRGHIGIALAAPQCRSTRSRRRCSPPARRGSAASRSGTAAGRRRLEDAAITYGTELRESFLDHFSEEEVRVLGEMLARLLPTSSRS